MDAAFGGMASVVQLTGLVLLHFLWQGAFVGAVFGLLRNRLSGGTPRYTLGLICFAALIAAPVLTALVLSADGTAAPALAAATAGGAAAAGITTAAAQPGAWQQWMDYLPWLVALWGAGVAALSLRALLHWHGLNRLIRSGSPLPAWNDRLRLLCQQFGLGKVGLLYSAKVQTPTLVGWIRPVILLPAAVALGFPAAQIELILAHELGHLRRWDHIVNLLQVVAETVLFYHPVVHWISRDLRDQREICCDELVLRMSKASPRDYVATLADLEQLRLDGPGALALSATGGVLLERVQHIAKVPTTHTQIDLRAPVRLLPLLVVGLVVIVLGYTQRAAWENSTMLALLAPQPLREVLLRDPAQIRGAPPVVADMLADRRLSLPRLPLFSEPAAGPLVPAAADSVTAAPVAAPVIPALVAPAVAASAPPPAVSAAPLDVPAPPALLQPTRVEAAALREPIAAHAVQPAYPERALLRGTEGSVKLSYVVDDAGRVRDVRVEQSTPSAVFDSSALTALRKWRFVPGSFEAGTRRYTRQFVFALNGASASAVEETVDSNECRLITGTRICRRAGDLGQVELQATAALD